MPVEWQDILSTIPIFSFLGRAELEAVQELFVETTRQKGDVICRQGDPGDSFYLVLDGELEVWAGEDDRNLAAILKRGDFFGEMALLQGGKRTATVIASRRVRLLSLDRDDFNSLFLKNPKALEYFTRVLCKRLASTSKGEVSRESTMTIAVVSRPGLKGKSVVAASLAGVMHDLTGQEVLLLRTNLSEAAPDSAIDQLLSDNPAPLGNAGDAIRTEDGVAVIDIPLRQDKSVEFYGERASNVVSKLADRFPFMIFDLCSEPECLAEAVPLFCDIQIEIVRQAAPVAAQQHEAAMEKPDKLRRFPVVNLYNPGARRVPINSCSPFVMPRDAVYANENCVREIRKTPRSPAALPVHRLARKLLGASVGLALGGGAAFGIAHLGVLKVLEQNGIPVDLVAGCSQGSIIAVGYAAGIPVEEMIKIALRLGRRQNSLMAVDLTLTKPGILAGNRFINIFSPLLGNKRTFEDLVLPCRAVATDIESGERVAIGEGGLVGAFRASASVPMVFSPVKNGNRVLVDGGVSDPVPAEVVNSMGADLCLAVNVVPPLKKGVVNAVSHAIRVLSRLNPVTWLEDSAGLPNMFDIIMNAMQTLQYELGNFKAISADVLINPELSDFTWVEYYRSAELIQRGIVAAERALPAIQRAYDQKLGPWRTARRSSTVSGAA